MTLASRLATVEKSETQFRSQLSQSNQSLQTVADQLSHYNTVQTNTDQLIAKLHSSLASLKQANEK